jgi:Transglutaminase-like superfamily/Coenzyme PQQ synthesis protein D (PqqD)
VPATDDQSVKGLTITESSWHASRLTRTLAFFEGCIVLELRGGKFHSLNGVGAAIWEILRTNPNVFRPSEIAEALSKRFAQAVNVEKLVMPFLAELMNKGLISRGLSSAPDGENVHKASVSSIIQKLPKQSGDDPKSSIALKACAYFILFRCGRILHSKGYYALRCHVHDVPISKQLSIEELPPNLWQCRDAIDWALLHFPYQAMCLQRSAALTILLRQHAVNASVVIGCEPLPFYSHAWVEVGPFVINDTTAVRKRFSIIDYWS